MQHTTEASSVYSKLDPGALSAAATSSDKAGIDPMTLAKLDTGLFKCLHSLGTSRQRICSALCLSYIEYDYILDFLHKR